MDDLVGGDGGTGGPEPWSLVPGSLIGGSGGTGIPPPDSLVFGSRFGGGGGGEGPPLTADIGCFLGKEGDGFDEEGVKEGKGGGGGVVGEGEAWLNQLKLVSTHFRPGSDYSSQKGFSNVGNILFAFCTCRSMSFDVLIF